MNKCIINKGKGGILNNLIIESIIYYIYYIYQQYKDHLDDVNV